MSTVITQILSGFFLDSVELMRISRTVADFDGIEEAALMMGTPANKLIMQNAGLLTVNNEIATGGDLILSIKANDESKATAALEAATKLLIAPREKKFNNSHWQPRSLRTAIEILPDANLALISVPGEFAAAEARKAIRRGLHVMIFSDNVSIEEERALKTEALEYGLLVMGPDCGTAIIGGVPLAFANVVQRGNIGIVGASGTGMQEISCLIDRWGGGISHAIGVGGRDLSDEIGGITTFMAMKALETDPETKHIVLVSKPPAPAVAAKVAEQISRITKNFTLCLIGGAPLELPDNARQVFNLKDAAIAALDIVPPQGAKTAYSMSKERKGAKGFFCGGTLAAEAQTIFQDVGLAVSSNAPVLGASKLNVSGTSHPMIDLGADEYTRGRPHPMIDPSVRENFLTEAFSNSSLGITLLDVILGYGAHPDPADIIANQLAMHIDNHPLVIASVTGTDKDPQNRAAQVAKLEANGVLVAPSSTEAAQWAVDCLRHNN